MIKVSIIVPIYNCEVYLEKCLKSILNQSLKDIEIILINDGSTDHSKDIIKRYHDKRIIYLEKNNEGIGKTRNLGIKKASGEYFAFLDADDYLEKNFAKIMYEKAIKDNCDLVICDYYEDCDEINQVKLSSFKDGSLKEDPQLINKINLGPCNKLYKKELFNNFQNRFIEDLKYEDAPFVIRMLIAAKKIGKVNKCLTHYVIHEKSETTIRDKRIFDIIKIVDIINNDLDKINFAKDVKTNLNVSILTDYTIQQRYISNKVLRQQFIDQVFAYLAKVNPQWRKCSYLKKIPLIKRIVKSHKSLTKLYCTLYVLKNKK